VDDYLCKTFSDPLFKTQQNNSGSYYNNYTQIANNATHKNDCTSVDILLKLSALLSDLDIRSINKSNSLLKAISELVTLSIPLTHTKDKEYAFPLTLHTLNKRIADNKYVSRPKTQL
jgi:hypothetical protein